MHPPTVADRDAATPRDIGEGQRPGIGVVERGAARNTVRSPIALSNEVSLGDECRSAADV